MPDRLAANDDGAFVQVGFGEDPNGDFACLCREMVSDLAAEYARLSLPRPGERIAALADSGYRLIAEADLERLKRIEAAVDAVHSASEYHRSIDPECPMCAALAGRSEKPRSGETA